MSEAFLSQDLITSPGTSITGIIEGNSTVLLEVQALSSKSYYSMPRRVATGIDLNRLYMLLAVLEKVCKLYVGENDIYVNVIGGMKVEDTACDLAIIASILSSYKGIIIEKDNVFLGEVGLTR